jgi:hypothetical protein
MSLKTELEKYFENGMYPFVKDTMKQNIANILSDASIYDEQPLDTPDDVKTEFLDNILLRLLRIKEANDKFSNIFNNKNC